MEIEKLKTGNSLLREIANLKLLKAMTICSMENIPFSFNVNFNFFNGDKRGFGEGMEFKATDEYSPETIKKVEDFFDGLILDIQKQIEQL